MVKWLSGRKNFICHVVPSKGLAGGLALGVNEDFFDVIDISEGDYCIRMLVKEKMSGFMWNLVTICGVAHKKDKEKFLVEFAQVLIKLWRFYFYVGRGF